MVREGSRLQLELPELRLVAARAGTPGGGAEVVTADVMDPKSIAPVIAGHDAVLSALGPRPKGPSDILTTGASGVLQALGDVRRYLVVSVAGIHGGNDDPFTQYVVKPILQRLLREGFADARRMEELVGASTVDWTICCPPRLSDKPAKGTFRSNTDGSIRGGFTMTRADVAAYMLNAIDDRSVIRKTVVISN
ncbi:NAD(P)-dependent oxidoreductase [Kribbella sp. NPDC059898]|uniref:NAD(P)-dependent oxidoreductase n=1 Tax=Kribbella sp. NPDC059898 TaxID=3346995 RepID=UPI0036480DBD